MEERITEVETPSGNTHTSHTVVDRDGDRGGGSGWVIAIVLVLALLIGGYFLMRSSNSDVVKDNAIAGAAKDIGNAAEQVGDAAQNAVKP